MADVIVSSNTAETLNDTDLKHPLFIQPTGADPSISYTGEDMRYMVSKLMPGNGIITTGDFLLSASGTGRTVNVAAGTAVVASQAGVGLGSYLVRSIGQVQVTLPANSSGSTMTYRFLVEVRDKRYSGTKYDSTIIAVESAPGGTPTTAAVLKAAGRHVVELGTVTVTNGLATITSGNITNAAELSTYNTLAATAATVPTIRTELTTAETNITALQTASTTTNSNVSALSTTVSGYSATIASTVATVNAKAESAVFYKWRKNEIMTNIAYAPGLTIGGTYYAMGTGGGTTGWTYFFPVQIPNACTIGTMSFQGGPSGGTCNTYWSIYTDLPGAASRGPNTQLKIVSQSMGSGFNGGRTITFNQDISSPGLYWFGATLWPVVSSDQFYFYGYTASQTYTNNVTQGFSAALAYNSGASQPATDVHATTMTWGNGNLVGGGSTYYYPQFQFTVTA